MHPGFLRQWPSLPAFGIFLTTRVLPVPHVEDADRYVVSRVEVLPGFYGVAQFLGFRDEAALHFDEIVARVAELEERYAVREKHTDARHRVEQLLDLARRPTHVCVPSLPLVKLVLTDGMSQRPALYAEEQELGDGRPSHADRELPPPCTHRGLLRAT